MLRKKQSSKRLFSFCFLFSLCLHGGTLFFLQNFYSFRITPYPHEKSLASLDKIPIPQRRGDSPVLRLSFQKSSLFSAKGGNGIALRKPCKEKEEYGSHHSPEFLSKTLPEEFVPLHFSRRNPVEKKSTQQPKNYLPIFSKKEFLATHMLQEKMQPKPPPKIEEVKQESPESPLEEKVAPVEATPPLEQKPILREVPTAELSPFHWKEELLAPKRHLFVEPKEKKSLIDKKFSFSFRMPSSSELHILSCSHDFDLDVVYNLRQDGEGYLFALSFIPKNTLSLQRIKQNYLFFVDRSHSIGEERFFSTISAVMSALSLLDKEDTFNIIMFDNRSECLFEKNMPVNSSTIRHAKEFLQHQKMASFFSSTNISRPLFIGWERLMKEEGSKTIVYLSNGETLDKVGHRKAIYDWTKKNNGAVSFYSVTLKADKKMPILEYFSAINKGKLYASQTTSGFKRQLRKLLHSIRSPLAQNMEAYIYLMKEGAEIALYPSLKRMSNLYLDQPFVLLGTTKKLEPFTLFLQGKNKDQWFHIKKEISFKEARGANRFLYEEWALERAFHCYDLFLQDGNQSHLKEAKNLLSPYCLEEAFR